MYINLQIRQNAMKSSPSNSAANSTPQQQSVRISTSQTLLDGQSNSNEKEISKRRGNTDVVLPTKRVQSSGDEINYRSDPPKSKEHRPQMVTFNVTSLRSRSGWPSWTEKFPFYPDEDELQFLADAETNATNVQTLRRHPPSVCFVHIGKTAGSTLACHLGFQYPACGTHNVAVVPGSLARYTTNIIHTRFDTCHGRNRHSADASGIMDLHVFAIRHPLARLQSWFTYERPMDRDSPQYKQKKPLFIDCHYRTLNELALALTPIVNALNKVPFQINNPTVCARRAWQAVTGQVGYSRHNKYNYGYYSRQVFGENDQQNVTIAVIRTEHLAADYNAIQVQFFGDEPLTSNEEDFYFDIRTNPSQAHSDRDRLLDETARYNLCAALCQELHTYTALLQRAQNLSPLQLQTSLTELVQLCPHHNVASASCPDVDLDVD